ncbi:MAG: polysaccharide biosynthesis C-terminal domain-containing protein [Acidimicrobiales bacterium]
MPGRRELRERVSYNAVLRVSGRTAGAILTVYALHLATHYFKSKWGEIVAASALANFFAGICDFGVARIASRDLAAQRDMQSMTYGTALWAGVLASVVAMAVMVPAAVLIYWQHPVYRSLSLDLVLSLPPNALWVVSASVLVARARNDMRAIIDVVSSLLLLGATGAVVAASLSTAGYVWLTVLADALTAVLGLALARRYVRADLAHSRPGVPKMLRTAAPVGAGLLCYSLYMQGDVVLLALVAPSRIVGAFGVAFQVVVFGTTVPSMLTAAMLPKFMTGDLAARQRLAQRALDVLALVGAGVVLLGVIFARGVLVAIGGHGFASATASLAVLSGFAGIYFPLAVFLDGLVFVNAERDLLRVLAAVAALNLVAAAIVIPIFGAVGAAAVMTGSAVVQAVLSSVLFRRRSGLTLSVKRSCYFVVVAAVVLGLSELVHVVTGVSSSESWLLVPEVAAVAVVYGAGSIGLAGRDLLRRS